MTKNSFWNTTFKMPFVKHIQVDLSHNIMNYTQFFRNRFCEIDNRDFGIRKSALFLVLSWQKSMDLFCEAQQSLVKALKLRQTQEEKGIMRNISITSFVKKVTYWFFVEITP